MRKKIITIALFFGVCILLIFVIPSFGSLIEFIGKGDQVKQNESIISESEILTLVNLERSYVNLPPLSSVSTLRASALVKLEDMESQQYFEHVSPQGTDVSDLATRSGYEFLVVGENLAVGPFSNAKDLVAAWMASPGHRANILNSSYHDTGIAVKSIVYLGQEQWMAVEHFGTRTSECPKIDSSLKTKINTEDAELKSLGQALDVLEKEIDGLADASPLKANKVLEYNIKVSTYNTLLKALESHTATYNASVQKFNNCASQFTAGEE